MVLRCGEQESVGGTLDGNPETRRRHGAESIDGFFWLTGMRQVIYFMSLVFLPLMLASCYASLRLWRGRPLGADSEGSVYTFLGDGNARVGSSASYPALSLGMTSLALFYVLNHFADRLPEAWDAAVAFLLGCLAVTALALLVASVTVLLFMQPWFLVPPPLRGRHGYVFETWKRLRGSRDESH